MSIILTNVGTFCVSKLKKRQAYSKLYSELPNPIWQKSCVGTSLSCYVTPTHMEKTPAIEQKAKKNFPSCQFVLTVSLFILSCPEGIFCLPSVVCLNQCECSITSVLSVRSPATAMMVSFLFTWLRVNSPHCLHVISETRLPLLRVLTLPLLQGADTFSL